MAIDVDNLAGRRTTRTTAVRGRAPVPPVDDTREVRRVVADYDREFDDEYQFEDAPPKPSRWGRRNKAGDDRPRNDKPRGHGIAGIVILMFFILLTIAGTAIAIWQSVLTTPTSTNALKYLQITQAIGFIQVVFLFLYILDTKRHNP